MSQPNLIFDQSEQDIVASMKQLTISKHQPFVLSGCSGAGKGTLVKYLLENFSELFELSVSYTTRKKRPTQQHGREYFFVSVDEFESQMEKDGFLECGKIYGNYYGTHKGEIQRIMKKGKICILEIDLTAAQKINAMNPDYHYLFLNVPTIDILRERMVKRGTENPQVIQTRMDHSRKQLQRVKKMQFYEHIVNEDLEKTKADLIQFINTRYNLNLKL